MALDTSLPAFRWRTIPSRLTTNIPGTLGSTEPAARVRLFAAETRGFHTTLLMCLVLNNLLGGRDVIFLASMKPIP